MANIIISFLAVFLLTLSNPVWADSGGTNVAPGAKSKTSITIPAQIKVVTDMLRVLNEPDLANDLEKEIRSGRIAIGKTGGARAVTGVNALDRSLFLRHILGSGTIDNYMTISDDILQEIVINPRAAKNVNNLTNTIGWAMTLRHEYVHMGQRDPKPEPQFENPAYRETNKTGVAWYNTAKTELREALTAPPTQDNLEKIRQIRLRMDIVGKQVNETFNDMHALFADGSLNPDTWVTLDGARTKDVEDARKQNLATMSRDQTQFDAAIVKFAAAVAPSAGSNAEMAWVLKITKREDRICFDGEKTRQIKIEEGKLTLPNPQGSVTVKWSLPPRFAKPGNLPLTAEGSRSGSEFYLEAGINLGYGSQGDDLTPLSSPVWCENPAGRFRQNICSVGYRGSIKGRGMLTFPPGAPGKQFRVFLHAWAGDKGDYSFTGKQARFEYIYEWASGATQASGVDESGKAKSMPQGKGNALFYEGGTDSPQTSGLAAKSGWNKANEQEKGRVFIDPTVGGRYVDNCLNWGRNCQKPAADNYCQRNGFSGAVSFTLANRRPTWVLADGKECNGDFCVGFSRIVCGGKSLTQQYPSQSDNDVPSTPAGSGQWQSVGTGDCPGRDVAGTAGPNPDPSKCTEAMRGQTAVCWDHGCTYKNIATGSCKGGANPGRMYTCHNSSTYKQSGKEQVYIDPRINGRYVDNCLNWGRNCQKPAADNYCQRNGFSGAVSFTLANRRPTWVLADGKECNGDFCVGFSRIVCGGRAARAGESGRKTNNSGNNCWSGHFTGTDISGYPMDITLSEKNDRVEGGYRYYHRAQQKEVTAIITDTSLQGNSLRGRWKQTKGIIASGNFEWKWLPNAQCQSFEGTFDGTKYWGKMTKN